MAPTTLTDLPPELLDYITTYIPTASSLASLGATSKTLHRFVEKDAWPTFARTRFPSLVPTHTPLSKDVARSLTTLSRAWDRRAFVSRYVHPNGDVMSYPEANKVERWKKPRGQTIGFTPHLDVYEETGSRWQDRREMFVFSAGAEVCVREKSHSGNSMPKEHWMTYRPSSAHEGRDDITTLHLIRPREDEGPMQPQEIVVGRANGDLSILRLPNTIRTDVPVAHLETGALPVRSSSLIQSASDGDLLAANLGDTRLSLFAVDSSKPRVEPLSSIDIKSTVSAAQAVKHQRIWSTVFLSPELVAVGIGPSSEPIHIYSIMSTGFDAAPRRRFGLQNDMSHRLDTQLTLNGSAKKTSSSVYPIVALPTSSTGSSHTPGDVFISGAYDGVIRLHDLRSDRDVSKTYTDPSDDGAIYSLLPRGQETLLAGSSTNSLLKIFDLRMGAKCYSYLDATTTAPTEVNMKQASSESNEDWSLFLHPRNDSSSNRGSNNRGAWSRHRSQASSIYSLCSASATSPSVYAGIEGSVLELAFTAVADRSPDPVFFRPWLRKAGEAPQSDLGSGWNAWETVELAMVEQGKALKLWTQRNLWEMRVPTEQDVTTGAERPAEFDERWQVGNGQRMV